MRLQIATLVFLVVSSNALAVPRRRDIIHHNSISTSRRSLETRDYDASRLDVRGTPAESTGDAKGWDLAKGTPPDWNWLDQLSCILSPNC
jgi:hypothetical protein